MISDYSEEYSFKQQENHWYTFDYVKGILIVLVFMGHVIPGVLRDTFPRYIIYSFHMPLFIGVSGFLLKIDKFDTMPLELIKKYLKRLISPWLIAVIFYFGFNIFLDGNISSITIKSIILAFVRPSYHLWYVLGFVSYLIISYFLWMIFKRKKNKWIYIFIISACISIVSKWNLLPEQISNTFLYSTIQHDFRLYNLIFFIFGIYCRCLYEHFGESFFDKFIEMIRVCMGLSIITVTVLFFFSHTNIEYIMFYVMNICILFVVFYDCINSNLPRSKVFEFMGKYSMPIYLYHVLCKNFSFYLFNEYTEGYYIVTLLCFIIGCISIYFLRNVKFINRILFGSTTSSLSSRYINRGC